MHAASNTNLPSLHFQKPKIKIASSSGQEVPIFDHRSELQSDPLSLLLPFLHLNLDIYGHWGRGFVPTSSYNTWVSTSAWCTVIRTGHGVTAEWVGTTPQYQLALCAMTHLRLFQITFLTFCSLSFRSHPTPYCKVLSNSLWSLSSNGSRVCLPTSTGDSSFSVETETEPRLIQVSSCHIPWGL